MIELAPGGAVAREVAAIVAQDRPDPAARGLVLFFTGLSGSGKSTLARALMDRLLEAGERSVTSLDGDVVRRHLSAGLTFSKADRETNIRRIGWVAAEISRHGGVAVCSPIAPFDETRQQVRTMVDEAGGAFFLVHVATPLAECERRDRKGLYAKARAGEIPEFTGISSPYEEPEDADVRVDTTGRTIDDALADVVDALVAADYLPASMAEERARPRWSRTVAQQPSRDRAPARPLRLHRQHLPLPVHGAPRPPAWPATRRSPSPARARRASTSHAMDPEMAAELAARDIERRRLHQPPGHRRDHRVGRPRPDRGVDATAPSSSSATPERSARSSPSASSSRAAARSRPTCAGTRSSRRSAAAAATRIPTSTSTTPTVAAPRPSAPPPTSSTSCSAPPSPDSSREAGTPWRP